VASSCCSKDSQQLSIEDQAMKRWSYKILLSLTTYGVLVFQRIVMVKKEQREF